MRSELSGCGIVKNMRQLADETKPKREKYLPEIIGTCVMIAILIGAAILMLGPEPSQQSASKSVQKPVAETSGAFGVNYQGLLERMAAAGVPTTAEIEISGIQVHNHASMLVYVNGQEVSLPADIGIDPALPDHAGLHTHDTTGKLHLEGIEKPTLGQFFETWGVKFSSKQLGSYKNTKTKIVRMWVNGQSSNAFASFVLEEGSTIVISYGSDAALPKS